MTNVEDKFRLKFIYTQVYIIIFSQKGKTKL